MSRTPRVQSVMLEFILALLVATGTFGQPALATPPAPTVAAEPLPAETSPAEAEEPAKVGSPLVDPATGRDLANYPPHPRFDYLHLRLSMDIPDIESPAFEGELALSAIALGSPRTQMILDAGPGLDIHEIRVDGLPATFQRMDTWVEINLPTEARPAPAAPITVNIRYSATKTESQGAGLVWRKSENDSVPAQVFSQGQPDANRLWIPHHDFPNDRLTSELLVTVQDGYSVVSNGKLVSRSESARGRTTWRWLQAQPHPSYLIMVAIGKFDQIELNPDDGSPDGPSSHPRLSMPVYGPPGSADKLRDVYAKTPAMLKFFEEKFDHPYPWDKYAQVVVRDFNWGGMENTSASIMTDSTIRLPANQDDLIAHELAHQWLGNLITCRTWAHLWLNEGWATYCEALWAEHEQGDKAYRAMVRGSVRRLKRDYRREPAVNPGSIPLVSNRYHVPDDTFSKSDDPYAKGGFVLHMLRKRLGDEVFFKGLREYIDRYAFKQVETDDFRRVMEEVSGDSLERFFTQWCYRAGIPNLNVRSEWDAAGGVLSVTVEQLQTINDANPAYAVVLPLLVEIDGADPIRLEFKTEQRTVTTRFSLPAQPVSLNADPDMTVLANFTFEGLKAKAW